MKLKDYFIKLKENGKITNADYDAFLETVPDTELPDSVYASIEENYLTRDRAYADKALGGKIRAEVYDSIDAAIAEILPSLDVFNAKEIHEEKDTFKKLKLVNKGVADKIEKSKTPGQPDKKVEEQLQKNVDELTEKIKSINAEYQTKLEDLTKNHSIELEKRELNHVLMSKIGSYTFADEFSDPKRKEAATKLILAELETEGNHLSLKDGQIIVSEIDNGVPKPKFNGNEPVTIEKLLESAVDPFIKKNGATKTEATPKTIPAPQTGGTLRELRHQARTTV